MTYISQEQVNWSTRWPCRWAVTVLICALLPAGLWSSSGSAQEPTPQELKPLDTASAQEPTPQELKPLDSVHPKPKKLSRAPVTKPPSLPKPMSVVAPGNATILGGSLATELASCDKGTERSEPLRLPGAKGEIKLDRCYRGRDHLVCSFHALLREAKALFNDYGKIVQADYPNLDNVAAVCSLQPDDLAANLKNASAFNARFKILKSEYALRAACASKFEQSLRDVMLPDMAHGQDILKSLVDSLQADIKDVIAVQKEVSDLANKIEASQKAMTTIRNIHPSICKRDQSVSRGADDAPPRASRTIEAN
jgi:hypothetical protein